MPDGPIYDGRICLKVKEFRKIPNRRFQIKFENYYVEISVRCFGYDKSLEERENRKKKKDKENEYDD